MDSPTVAVVDLRSSDNSAGESKNPPPDENHPSTRDLSTLRAATETPDTLMAPKHGPRHTESTDTPDVDNGSPSVSL